MKLDGTDFLYRVVTGALLIAAIPMFAPIFVASLILMSPVLVLGWLLDRRTA